MSPSSKVFRKLAELFIRQYTVNDELKPDHPKQKIVVIVGAGASAWSAMPTWGNKHLIQRIFNIAKDSFRNPSDFVDELWHKLAVHIGLEPPGWKDLDHEERERRFLRIPNLRLDHICGVACENTAIRQRILQ